MSQPEQRGLSATGCDARIRATKVGIRAGRFIESQQQSKQLNLIEITKKIAPSKLDHPRHFEFVKVGFGK